MKSPYWRGRRAAWGAAMACAALLVLQSLTLAPDAHAQRIGTAPGAHAAPGHQPQGPAAAGADSHSIATGGMQVHYRRDATGQITGIDLQDSDGNGPVAFLTDLTYTALGQPQAWRWINGSAASRSYDTAGRMTANEFARYSYDAAGRMTGITQLLRAEGPQRGREAIIPVTWTIGHDPRGRITSWSADTQIHDPGSGAGLRPTLSTGTQTSPTRDAAGYVTADGTADAQRRYHYDAAARLGRIATGSPRHAIRVKHLYNAAGQLTYSSEPRAEAPTGLDALRSEHSDGFIDWLKRLFSWLFRRDQPEPDLEPGTVFMWSATPEVPAWALLGEYDIGTAHGRGAVEYIWLPTPGGAIPVGMVRNGQIHQAHAIHTDHLGSARLMTDANNETVWQWPYSARGETPPTGLLRVVHRKVHHEVQHSGPGHKAGHNTGNNTANHTANHTASHTASHTANNAANNAASTTATYHRTEPDGRSAIRLRHPGQYADAHSGLYYNQRRWYDPMTGRYLQPDPIGLSGGEDRYAYAEGNALDRIDPTGEFAILIPTLPAISGWAAGAAGAAAGGVIGWNVTGPALAKPPENAYDPNGPKAPGKPGEAEGFKDPKGGPKWVPNPNPGRGGSSHGWQDDRGRVWCPTGQGGRAHGGPHWDVQWPSGEHSNVPPGTNINDLR